ncbi:hypothetical protein GF358_04405 [Candidatus Woesearchaeota archaeon]|nr:hypothetical protein [Candidatus Woesearchaeota archaeon]
MGKESLDRDIERTGYLMQEAYNQIHNRSTAEKERFANLAYAMGFYAADIHVDSIESFLDERIKLLDDIDEAKQYEWLDEVRRFSAICDLLLKGECTYMADYEQAFRTSNKRQFSSYSEERQDRPTEEMDKPETCRV